MTAWRVMGLKKKHFTVIILSSMVIVVVLFSTIVGYTLYMQWKKDTFSVNYRNSIDKITAKIFHEDVVLTGVTVRKEHMGHFKGKPVIMGSIRNNSTKAVVSVLVEVSFAREDGTVLYRGWFYPLSDKKALTSSIIGSPESSVVLSPGKSLEFKYLLKSCPKDVAENIAYKSSFAKKDSGQKMNMDCTIAGIRVL